MFRPEPLVRFVFAELDFFGSEIEEAEEHQNRNDEIAETEILRVESRRSRVESRIGSKGRFTFFESDEGREFLPPEREPAFAQGCPKIIESKNKRRAVASAKNGSCQNIARIMHAVVNAGECDGH